MKRDVEVEGKSEFFLLNLLPLVTEQVSCLGRNPSIAPSFKPSTRLYASPRETGLHRGRHANIFSNTMSKVHEPLFVNDAVLIAAHRSWLPLVVGCLQRYSVLKWPASVIRHRSGCSPLPSSKMTMLSQEKVTQLLHLHPNRCLLTVAFVLADAFSSKSTNLSVF
jgi:hypothetical protein